jgi:hypothetical protein
LLFLGVKNLADFLVVVHVGQIKDLLKLLVLAMKIY